MEPSKYKYKLWPCLNPEIYNENRYLVIDTETTGLDLEKSRIVQISFTILDTNFEEIYELEDYIINITICQV